MVNLLFLPYMARALVPADYATYGQILLLVEMAVIFLSVTNNQYLYVLLSNSREHNKKDVLLTSFVANVALSLFGVVALLFSLDFICELFHNDSLKEPLRIYAYSVFPILLISNLNYVLYFFDRVKHAMSIQIVLNLFRVSAIVIGIQYFESLSIVFTFLLIINFAILFMFIPRFPVKFFSGKFRKIILRSFVKFGYVLALTGVIGTLIKKTDGLMVSSLLEDPSQYAIFRIGGIEIPFLMIFYSSVITVLLPDVTRLFAEGKIDELVSLKRKATSASALIIYPTLVFILFFSFPALSFYFGEQYLESIPIFIVFNLVMFFKVNDYRDVLVASSKTNTLIRADILVLVVNVILNFVLIQFLGAMGAAIATLISFILLAGLLNFKTTKFLDIKSFSFYDLKMIASVLLSSLALSFAFFWLYRYTDSLLFIPIFFVLYSAIIYSILYRVNFEAKAIISNVMGRFLNKRKQV